MLTREPTEQMIAEYKRIFEENRGKLSPDRKTGAEVDKYFRRKYAPLPYADEEFLQLVREDLLSNQFSREKLPKGAVPHIVAYKAGNVLAGIDLVSGFFMWKARRYGKRRKFTTICLFSADWMKGIWKIISSCRSIYG